MPRPPGSKNKFNADKLSDMGFDEFFASLPLNYTIKVHRKEPEWCAGYLGVIHVDPENPFNLDSMTQRFGGTLFDLMICDEQGKYVSRKTMRIADVPRKDYEEQHPDFATRDGAYRRQGLMAGNKSNNENGAKMKNPFEAMQDLPPDMQRKLMRWYLMGEEEEPQKKTTTTELMQQKLVMDMMQAQSAHQMAMQQHQLKYQAELDRMAASRQTEPLSDVKSTIALLRELNGMKNEFGGSENVATEIISQTAPILETALSELIALQKLKVQSEVAKAHAHQSVAPPLPPRSNPAVKPDEILIKDDLGGDLKSIAARLGQKFRTLPEKDAAEVLAAFLGQDSTFDTKTESDNNDENDYTVDVTNGADDLLDEEDKLALHDDNEYSDSPDVPNGIDTGAAQTDDTFDRQSDSQRSTLPTD